MQTVSIGDSLHKMSNSVYGKNKKNIINLSSAESAHGMVNINCVVLHHFNVLQKGHWQTVLTQSRRRRT